MGSECFYRIAALKGKRRPASVVMAGSPVSETGKGSHGETVSIRRASSMQSAAEIEHLHVVETTRPAYAL
jgi:hypothetical protein